MSTPFRSHPRAPAPGPPRPRPCRAPCCSCWPWRPAAAAATAATPAERPRPAPPRPPPRRRSPARHPLDHPRRGRHGRRPAARRAPQGRRASRSPRSSTAGGTRRTSGATTPAPTSAAFPGFTPGATRRATYDRDLMSNADIGDRVESVTPLMRKARLDLLAVDRRARSVTARFDLRMRVALTGERAASRRLQVRGRVFLTRQPAGWRVFGYDVTKGWLCMTALLPRALRAVTAGRRPRRSAALVVPDSAVEPTGVELVRVKRAGGVSVGPDVVWILAVGSDARPGQDMLRCPRRRPPAGRHQHPHRLRDRHRRAPRLVGLDPRPRHEQDQRGPLLRRAAGHGRRDAQPRRHHARLRRWSRRFPFFEDMVDDIGGITVDNPRRVHGPLPQEGGVRAGPHPARRVRRDGVLADPQGPARAATSTARPTSSAPCAASTPGSARRPTAPASSSAAS